MTSGPRARDVLIETKNAVLNLVQIGMADEVRTPVLVESSNNRISIQTPVPVDRAVLSAGSYAELYFDQRSRGAFHAVLPDGGMLQMCYEFNGRQLQSHRLAYLPSPDLEPFQNDPEMYIQDQPYIDVVGRQVVPVPMRFDFDARPGVARDLGHPAAHLTLGQYAHCRIAATGPIRPATFVNFILRHFYSTPDSLRETISVSGAPFVSTITTNERNAPHLWFGN